MCDIQVTDVIIRYNLLAVGQPELLEAVIASTYIT